MHAFAYIFREPHYDILLEFDPLINNFSHLCNSKYNKNNEKNLELIQSLDPVNYLNYNRDKSLLFISKTESYLQFMDQKPVSIDYYKIILTVGQYEGNNYAPIDLCRNCAKGKDDYCWCRADLDSVTFNSILVCPPGEVAITDCHGDKCRKTINSQCPDCWCTACHGDFDSADKLWYLIDRPIHFSELPKEAILKIIKKSKPITGENKNLAIELLEEKIAFATELENTISNTSAEIQKAIECLLREKERCEIQLEKHRQQYGETTHLKKIIENFDQF